LSENYQALVGLKTTLNLLHTQKLNPYVTENRAC